MRLCVVLTANRLTVELCIYPDAHTYCSSESLAFPIHSYITFNHSIRDHRLYRAPFCFVFRISLLYRPTETIYWILYMCTHTHIFMLGAHICSYHASYIRPNTVALSTRTQSHCCTSARDIENRETCSISCLSVRTLLSRWHDVMWLGSAICMHFTDAIQSIVVLTKWDWENATADFGHRYTFHLRTLSIACWSATSTLSYQIFNLLISGNFDHSIWFNREEFSARILCGIAFS